MLAAVGSSIGSCILTTYRCCKAISWTNDSLGHDMTDLTREPMQHVMLRSQCGTLLTNSDS